MKKTIPLVKIESSLPKPFVERLKNIIPPQKYQETLTSFAQKRPTTLRTNTLKIKSNQLRKDLADKGILIHPVPWYSDAFYLDNISLRDLEKTKEYSEGLLYVQSLSSMIPPIILNPNPHQKVLDITAAPGSKTTQIAAFMGNQGELIANDISPIRILKLKSILNRLGVTNTKVTQKPAERIWLDYPEYFDKVLVDAPCSMEGRCSIWEKDSMKNWSVGNINKLSYKQKTILRSAVSAAKVGAYIVYSTCTLSAEENEEVVDWILNKEKGALEIEPIHIPHLSFLPGMTEWDSKRYHPNLQKTLRILPDKYMEGFYIAKLKKIRSTVHPLS